MKEMIKSYLVENEKYIHKVIKSAVEASVYVGEGGGIEDEKTSVVLTNEFEIETLRHHKVILSPTGFYMLLHNLTVNLSLLIIVILKTFLARTVG